MRKITSEVKRTYVTLNKELDDKFILWSDKLSITKTNLMTMSMQAGLDAILRAVSPMEYVTPEMWSKILAAYVRDGQAVTLPDGTVFGAGNVEKDKK